MNKNISFPCGWLFLFVLGFLLLCCITLHAETLTGCVVKVSDGDTFTLLTGAKKQVRVRLHGIDAPEMSGSQPYCRQAKDRLAALIAAQTVKVQVKNYDRYKRAVGVVFRADGLDVNLQMLKDGLAWHYSHFDKTPAYIRAERQARTARRGLWRDKNPINPYQWRKNKNNR